MAGGVVAELVARLRAENSDLKRQLNEVKNEINNLKGAAGSAGKEMSSMGGTLSDVFSGVGAKIAAFAATALAAIKTTKEVFDFSAEGAQMASLEQASYKLARAYGANMSDIVSSLKDASFNTITEIDAMKAANLAMTMGISTNATEMANLLQIAMERGRAFGLTTEEAFDRIARGIGRRSTKILDDLGFSTDAIRINKEYAESLGISTNALTDQMKVRALMLDILKQGNSELEKQGGLSADISSVYQHLNTLYTDWWNRAKMGAGLGFANMFAVTDTSQNLALSAHQQAANLAVMKQSYKEYYNSMSRAINAAAAQGDTGMVATLFDERSFEGYKKKLYQATIAAGASAREANDALGVSYNVLTGKITWATDALTSYADAEALSVALSGDLQKVFDKYADSVEKAGRNTKKIDEVTQEAQQSLKDYAYNALTAGMNLDQYGDFVYKAALHFGQMTEAEFEAARTARELQKYIMDNNLTFEQAQPLISNYNAGLDQLMAGGKSDYFVYVHFITVGGVPGGMVVDNRSTGTWGGSPYPSSKPGGKHGGTFIGMAHGGIVPPGFANDGYPIFVSSGERVDVTPAGNKNIEGGGNTMRFYGPVTFQVSKDIRKEDLISQLRL